MEAVKLDLDHRVTPNLKPNLEEDFWVILFSGYKYGIKTHLLDVIKENDNTIDITFYFETKIFEEEENYNQYLEEELKQRIAVIDSIYNFLKEKNPKLNEERIKDLFLKLLEQNALEQNRSYSKTLKQKVN